MLRRIVYVLESNPVKMGKLFNKRHQADAQLYLRPQEMNHF